MLLGGLSEKGAPKYRKSNVNRKINHLFVGAMFLKSDANRGVFHQINPTLIHH